MTLTSFVVASTLACLLAIAWRLWRPIPWLDRGEMMVTSVAGAAVCTFAVALILERLLEAGAMLQYGIVPLIAAILTVGMQAVPRGRPQLPEPRSGGSDAA